MFIGYQLRKVSLPHRKGSYVLPLPEPTHYIKKNKFLVVSHQFIVISFSIQTTAAQINKQRYK
ncbi:MAG: hypothetical protein COW85_14565 [Ignavibacteria bacterium CG22_combo_CG10-13_8_21_14_all_37_15]|nr:MAG: hypothetical protein AUJ54_05635 [Ignavibacteria bacterium CG1_02_37_35]PIP76366.1 MAG: hypothetical protein COW85_14565 [Ignavibacteria bacterium CG22_combo_CG10-13_8_21_14_all_37_15]PIS45663.1 MAG: hypothetical protein COT22_04075 [Ignavibacteria bacterium CG08_land_8_20_14_0_20_37_9]PIX94303.1 MAG: hypothetical protein COZ25_06245 [Ignavibacteria bacterium CG_4_10_14_3_um_filter_37_18]PJC61003.1 MAG: hypothetical protein CO025_01390 [Ignavibacteria bacterium CG_4_9_14_0_2_um_filter_3